MFFKKVKFKKGKVFARVDENGKLMEKAGRVEIIYKPKDPRIYNAGMFNISEIEGEEIIEVSEEDITAAKEKKPAKAKTTAKKKTANTKQVLDQKDVLKADKDTIVVWTDGACSGNPGDAGSGVVLIFGDKRMEISHFLGKATNNIAELFAIKIALEKIKNKNSRVLLYTDSSYSLGVLTKGWKAKKNPELVAEIRELLAPFTKLQFVKVAGHAGIEENEKADELARLAVSSKKNSEKRFG